MNLSLYSIVAGMQKVVINVMRCLSSQASVIAPCPSSVRKMILSLYSIVAGVQEGATGAGFMAGASGTINAGLLATTLNLC
jgi:hypothetical protein